MLAGELQKQKALFAIVDGVALGGAFSMSVLLYDPAGNIRSRLTNLDVVPFVGALFAIASLWVLVFRAADLYRLRRGGVPEAWAIVKACCWAALITFMVLFLAHIHDLSRLTIVLSCLLTVPFVLFARALLRSALRRCYSSPRITIPLVIFGFNPVAHYLLDQMLDGITHYDPVGFLAGAMPGHQYRGYPVLGPPELLSELTSTLPSLKAAIAMPDAAREEQQTIVDLCEHNHVRWSLVPWILRSSGQSVRVDHFGKIPVLSAPRSNILGLNFVLKRAVDIIAASVLMLLSVPLVGIAALLIRLTDGKPVLFRQTRVGIGGELFELMKLRTMHSGVSDTSHRDYVHRWIDGDGNPPLATQMPQSEASVLASLGTNGNHQKDSSNGNGLFKMANDQRITPIGGLLRRFSIDELPQLVNVLRGEMSLIGPRPALPYELEFYEEWHRGRLDAMPGITGLWQVSGRNRLSFDEMVRLDLQYLQGWSFVGDLKILMRTVPVLVRGSGV